MLERVDSVKKSRLDPIPRDFESVFPYFLMHRTAGYRWALSSPRPHSYGGRGLGEGVLGSRYVVRDESSGRTPSSQSSPTIRMGEKRPDWASTFFTPRRITIGLPLA